MARRPRLNYTPSLAQFTVTVAGKLHRLGTDKEAAERQFKFLTRQAEKGVAADPGVTFADVADAFLGHVDRTYSRERLAQCVSRLKELRRHLGDSFKARDLRPSHVDSWLAGRDLAGGSERLYKSIVLACLNWAARPANRKGGGLIAENPLRGLLHLPRVEARGGETVWPAEVYARVLAVSHPAFADLVRGLALTGARPSTVRRIEARHYNKAQSRWDCEDLYRGRASRAKYVTHVRLLSDEARELVERLNADHPEGPIFRNTRGRPWQATVAQAYLVHLTKRDKGFDYPEGICVYGIRHSFATNFLREHPGELEYLRVLLGHKDYAMILSHYSHLIDQHAHAFKRVEGFSPFSRGSGTSSSPAPAAGPGSPRRPARTP